MLKIALKSCSTVYEIAVGIILASLPSAGLYSNYIFFQILSIDYKYSIFKYLGNIIFYI